MEIPLKFKETGWDPYVNRCYPDGIGKEQGEQVKQAFYSGAMVMYIIMEQVAKNFPAETESTIIIKSILKEIGDEMNEEFSTRAKNVKEQE